VTVTSLTPSTGFDTRQLGYSPLMWPASIASLPMFFYQCIDFQLSFLSKRPSVCAKQTRSYDLWRCQKQFRAPRRAVGDGVLGRAGPSFVNGFGTFALSALSSSRRRRNSSVVLPDATFQNPWKTRPAVWFSRRFTSFNVAKKAFNRRAIGENGRHLMFSLLLVLIQVF